MFSDARRQCEVDAVVCFALPGADVPNASSIWQERKKKYKNALCFSLRTLCLSVLEMGLQSILPAAEW